MFKHIIMRRDPRKKKMSDLKHQDQDLRNNEYQDLQISMRKRQTLSKNTKVFERQRYFSFMHFTSNKTAESDLIVRDGFHNSFHSKEIARFLQNQEVKHNGAQTNYTVVLVTEAG